MSKEFEIITARSEDAEWREAMRSAGAFLATYRSPETRRGYQRDLHCWFAFCAGHDLHPYRGIRRTHIEFYLREAERHDPPPATATLYRRISTLSAWYRWLEDEGLHLGNPASRVRRPQRHASPQPWLNRNELTDLLAAAEDEGGHPYALTCLLGLNGLRVAEACGARIEDLAGSRYQPTLNVIGKGDKPAQIVLNPRTHQAIDGAIGERTEGPLLLNQWNNPMRRHNAAAIIRRLARRAGITHRVTPHALRRSYITVGLLQGVPLREVQRAARHAKADTTVAYDQSEKSFHIRTPPSYPCPPPPGNETADRSRSHRHVSTARYLTVWKPLGNPLMVRSARSARPSEDGRGARQLPTSGMITRREPAIPV